MEYGVGRRKGERRVLLAILWGLLLVAGLGACAGGNMSFVLAPPATETPPVTATSQPSAPTPTATAPAPPTITPSVAPSIAAPSTTAAPLPPPFTTTVLYQSVQPTAYITDTCAYLRQRWDPDGSPPGAIVVPVMYHSIGARANRGGGDTWTPTPYLLQTMEAAQKLGFETVTAAQVVDFLEHNARVPARSLLLIVDDRRLGGVEGPMVPILKANHWTVTLGWITGAPGNRPDLWERLRRLQELGLVDVQAHGLHHLYMLPSTPEQAIQDEISGLLPIFERELGQRPVAFIWPGGNYTPTAARIAREAGYRLAFTVHSRGPLMYNWIPLGPPERALNDPLMVLPRYWGYPGMIEQLARAVAIAEQARQHALASYPQEAAYYQQHCGGELPGLRSILP